MLKSVRPFSDYIYAGGQDVLYTFKCRLTYASTKMQFESVTF